MSYAQAKLWLPLKRQRTPSPTLSLSEQDLALPQVQPQIPIQVPALAQEQSQVLSALTPQAALAQDSHNLKQAKLTALAQDTACATALAAPTASLNHDQDYTGSDLSQGAPLLLSAACCGSFKVLADPAYSRLAHIATHAGAKIGASVNTTPDRGVAPSSKADLSLPGLSRQHAPYLETYHKLPSQLDLALPAVCQPTAPLDPQAQNKFSEQSKLHPNLPYNQQLKLHAGLGFEQSSTAQTAKTAQPESQSQAQVRAKTQAQLLAKEQSLTKLQPSELANLPSDVHLAPKPASPAVTTLQITPQCKDPAPEHSNLRPQPQAQPQQLTLDKSASKTQPGTRQTGHWLNWLSRLKLPQFTKPRDCLNPQAVIEIAPQEIPVLTPQTRVQEHEAYILTILSLMLTFVATHFLPLSL